MPIKMSEIKPEYAYTIKEVSEILFLSEQTIRKHIKENNLNSQSYGISKRRSIFIMGSDIIKFIRGEQ